ncbi:MAG: peptidoglycan DD-metalloendopeptidase family protein, partial [Xanthobacteraceae bacterium]
WKASRSVEAARAQQPAQHVTHHAPRDSAHRAEARGRPAGEPAKSAYTIAHAGRQVRFGPVAFWIAVGTVVIMAGWSVTAATYLAFRDDVLRTLIARQAQQQFGYEDRIAELRAQIDRTTSRQLLDQEQFEQKLDELMRRQAALEHRADTLNSFADPSITGSIGPAAKQGRDFVPALRSGRQSSVGETLDRMEASIDRVEARQTNALGALEGRYDSRIHRISSVLNQLGVRPETAASGGPFVPVRPPPAGEGFQRALFRVNLARSEAEQLADTLRTLPVRKPLAGDIDETSPFGVREDPFVHEAAMHTGMDMRGEVGESVHATAAGRVTIAGWDGGYGNLIEIDHGNGLSTRYGHLSQIDVRVGDEVRIGQVVGLVGTTGRSTGPHLHYETRINGEPVNPEKFLAAGEELFGGSHAVSISSERKSGQGKPGHSESLD